MSPTAWPMAWVACSTACPTRSVGRSGLLISAHPRPRHLRRYATLLAAASKSLASGACDRPQRRPPPRHLEEERRHRVDQQSGQRADHRAVDPDELEVAADLQLDLPRGLLRVPAL